MLLLFPGLDNAQLSTQKPFTAESARLLNNFLLQHEQPVCLVAHNGSNFDFPVLQAELHRVGASFNTLVKCLDSLPLFRSMPDVFGDQQLDSVSGTVCNSKQENQQKPPVCRRLDFGSSSTPSRERPTVQRVSYSLSNVYTRMFHRPLQMAHSAEGDCIALMQIFHHVNFKIRESINSFVDELML